MTKIEFLRRLEDGLSGLPQKDIEERLAFYDEMIDDRMEEGFSEEEAVANIGSVNDIIFEIVDETPLHRLVKEKVKKKRKMGAVETILLILGSPVWLSLLIAAFAVILALYLSLWAVIISLWAVFASVIGVAIGLIACGIIYICRGEVYGGVAIIGGAVVCLGLSILLFFGCKAATKGTVLLAKKTVSGIKKCFVKKEGAQ